MYNNAKFILIVLVAFFGFFSIIFKYFDLNIQITLTQFSFFLVLPLSQIFLAYKGMLDAIKLDGLTNAERDRLTSTVEIRSKSSLYVSLIFLLIVFLTYIFSSLDIFSGKILLSLLLSLGFTSIISVFLAWTDLKEIGMLEKTLKSRKYSQEAKSKALNNK